MNNHVYRVKTSKQLVLDYIHQKDIKQAALARKLSMTPQNLWGQLKGNQLNFDLLLEISNVLDHNFFKDLAEEYEREKRKSMPVVDMIMKEPEAVYGGLEAVVRKIVREEMKEKK